MAEQQGDPRLADWPTRAEYPQTEAGHNAYQEGWLRRRRSAPTLAQIPMSAVQEHRAAMALAQQQGWQDVETG